MRAEFRDPLTWQQELLEFHERAVVEYTLNDLISADTYIILEELISNYFKYSFSQDYVPGLSLTLSQIEEFLQMIIEYESSGFNPFMYQPEEENSVEDAKIGGKGLHMVRRLADSHVYCREGHKDILKLTKRLKTEDFMNVTIEEFPHVTVVHLDGRLDILSGEALQATFDKLIDEQKKYHLLVDCEQLSFISSAGLRLFMIILKKLNKLDGRLAFSAFNGNNKKIFEITGYNKFFNIYSSIEDGKKAFES
jgi:anti-anti-sigma factor